jgi:Zn-dependent protease with chaperone function
MLSFNGKYYSGADSSVIEAEFSVEETGVLRESGGLFDALAIGDLKISPRIGNSVRYLGLPDGAKIESFDNDTIDQIQARFVGPLSGIAHRLESSAKFVILAVAVLVVGLYGFFNYGIPAASGYITKALPVSLDERLGSELLEQLDELVFEPSTLSDGRQQELEGLFSELVAGLERDFTLQFRSSELIGANAFALPDAQIIFTDQLINLADKDEMLQSIMLHEIGHVYFRHSMQAVVRQAGVSVALVVLTGDVSSIATTLLVLLPTFMMQSQYSREFEWQADGYALEQMLARGIDTGNFAAIMEKMSQASAAELDSDVDDPATDGFEEEGPEEGFSAYFSTHPASQQRIDRFRRAADQ